jgi:hypothetical protein
MKFVFKVLDFLFKRQIIERDGVHYMWRWHIWKRHRGAGGLYLHYFLKGDNDDAPHDHPWDFMTFILRGGYVDEVWGDQKPRRYQLCEPGKLYRRKAEHRHRVLLPQGRTAWTFVYLKPKRREWGFYPNGKFTHWSNYTTKRMM